MSSSYLSIMSGYICSYRYLMAEVIETKIGFLMWSKTDIFSQEQNKINLYHMTCRYNTLYHIPKSYHDFQKTKYSISDWSNVAFYDDMLNVYLLCEKIHWIEIISRICSVYIMCSGLIAPGKYLQSTRSYHKISRVNLFLVIVNVKPT